MRTLICRSCCAFITAEKRDALQALRDHCLDEATTHAFTEVVAMDVEATFWAIVRS